MNTSSFRNSIHTVAVEKSATPQRWLLIFIAYASKLMQPYTSEAIAFLRGDMHQLQIFGIKVGDFEKIVVKGSLHNIEQLLKRL
jgi:hypothetical protein